MISDLEFLNVYAKPIAGLYNPNLFVELPANLNYVLLQDSTYFLLQSGDQLILQN